MKTKPTVLLVEDTLSLATLYQEYVRQLDCKVIHVETGADALEQLNTCPPDIVLLDIKLPDMSGLEVLRLIQKNSIATNVIVITAHGSVDIAVDAMRYGASDFLVKPFDAKRLAVTLNNAIERHRLSRIVETYRKKLDRDRYHGFIGNSLAMQTVYRIIDSAASSRATVFITGESGTGKEVCAKAIHQAGDRSKKPFVAINCAAIPRELMESEIFGHTKGAFTGATGSREGAAERANGGTLFLDEICEMEPDLQSKLLRFIQTGTYQKVGGSREENVDVRFVCATNRDPWEEVQAGRFREDLYYRLHVIPIELPPLRERDDDLIDIARELLRKTAEEQGKDFHSFSPEATKMLLGYAWPGNVRQLQNTIRNTVVLNNGEQVLPEMLTSLLSGKTQDVRQITIAQAPATQAADTSENRMQSAPEPSTTGAILPLWLEERTIIERAVARCDGNIPKAAAMLEVSPSTIYRKRQSWEQKDSTAAEAEAPSELNLATTSG